MQGAARFALEDHRLARELVAVAGRGAVGVEGVGVTMAVHRAERAEPLDRAGLVGRQVEDRLQAGAAAGGGFADIAQGRRRWG